MRTRWELRGWHFTPLENLEGENEVIDSLYRLRGSPICGLNIDKNSPDSTVGCLLENLEDFYRRSLQPWEQFRTVFDCKATQRDLLRWPCGTYSVKIRGEARERFWELKTTSRFSVNEIPDIKALRDVNWPLPPITERHAASLAAMVCIIEAIESLESVLSNWKIESGHLLLGKPFEWLVSNDPAHLEDVVVSMLESADERAFYIEHTRDAWGSHDQARLWLSHVDTLDVHQVEIKRAATEAKEQALKQVQTVKKKQARKAAAASRGNGRGLTAQMVADYFNANPGKLIKTLTVELSDLHKVHPRTVANRRTEAKAKNLMQ